ncbi:hypothetical protein Athai_04980 [Actinocatenispora thailandica]|uniref:Uncharacterized protein n=1 Tax=Actinocatenispora thailandica TaxID=227318 RepID=A0A7R7DJR0_9ACTN|nr:hypothetical protein Athai_04980 [Actinocatenispora thailandica]
MFAASAAVVAGATACNVQPGAAAFIDGNRITQAQVDDVFQSIIDAPAYQSVQQAPDGSRQQTIANMRTSAAGALIMHQLTQRVAADEHIEIPPANYAALARQTKLPESSKYVRLEAENQAAINTLRNAAWNTAPDDQAVREIYDSLATQANQNQLSIVPYEKAAPEIKKTPKVGQTAALRGTFQGAIKKYHVDVSPRYGQLEYPLDAFTVQTQRGPLSGQLQLQLGEGSPDVVHVVSTNGFTG